MTSENGNGECFRISVYDGRGFSVKREKIIREIPLEIYLNDRKIITIACAGICMDELAVGFLRSQGFLRRRSDIRIVEVHPDGALVKIRTAPGWHNPAEEREETLGSGGCFGFIRPRMEFREKRLPDLLSFKAVELLGLMDRFLSKARLHEKTGGTHAAALAQNGKILVVREDIGRHNTIDMLGGYALLHQLDCRDAVILRTGRVSSEIVQKIQQMDVRVFCSLSVPTTQAIKMAREAGITLIGAVRRGRMKIYAGEGRVGM